MISRVEGVGLVKHVTRFGLRYINSFKLDILRHSSLSIRCSDIDLTTKSSQIQLTAQISAAPFVQTLRVLNGASVKQHEEIIGESVIDIDTALNDGLDNFFVNRDGILDQAHEAEKRLFFELLSEEHITSLSPEY